MHSLHYVEIARQTKLKEFPFLGLPSFRVHFGWELIATLLSQEYAPCLAY